MEKLNEDHEDLVAAALAVSMTVVGEERSELIEAVAIEYAQRNELEKAVQVMESIQDPYLRDKGIGSIAVMAVDAGEVQFADQILNSIEDPSLLTVALEEMAVHHARRGNFETALELSDELEDSAQVCGGIAVAYANHGFPDQAIELARSIELALPRSLTLVQLALDQVARNDLDSAQELLAEAAEMAGEIEFPEDQVEAVVTIARAYATLGKNELAYDQLLEAIRLCDEIESTSGVITATSVRDHELAVIVSALANLKFFEKAEEVLETVEDPFKFALGSRELALAYHREQKEAEANELLEQAVEVTEDADVVYEQAVAMQQEVFSNVAHAYAVNGQIGKALEVVELVHLVGLKNHWLEEIGKVAVQLGTDPSVISESLSDAASKSSFWVVIGDTYGESNRQEEGDEALKLATKFADEGSDRPYEQVLAFNEIATRLLANRSEQASQLFQRTLRTIPGVASSTRRALILLDMARKYRISNKELNEQESELLREIMLNMEL